MQGMQEQVRTDLFLHKIVVAIDGSDNAKRAAQVAIKLAKTHNSELMVLYALTSPSAVYTSSNQPYIPEIDDSLNYYQDALKRATRIVDDLVDQAKKEGVAARGMVDRSVSSTVEAIVNQAINFHADLIVIGTRGLGGFKRLVMGSVSSGVVTHADCSVLVVR